MTVVITVQNPRVFFQINIYKFVWILIDLYMFILYNVYYKSFNRVKDF